VNVEGLACCVVGVRQVCVAVIFTDEHPETRNGMPVALVRGCAVAHDPGELERLLCSGVNPAGVRLYVEPGTTASEISSLWLAGFMVRIVRVADVFSVPGWWHLAAHRHHRAETRGVRCPPSRQEGWQPSPRSRSDVVAGPSPRCPGQ
jgi:hypothetical protein